MIKMRMLIVSLCLVLAASASQAASPFPPQVELRVPFHPTAFPSGGRTYLLYELHVTNFSGSTIDLRRIEVLDADEPSGGPLAAFEGEQIDALLQSSDAHLSTGESSLRQLRADAALVLFMQVTFDASDRIPKRVRHRVFTTDDSIDGALAETNHTKLKVFAPPMRGAVWHASDGPNNDRDNHHRRGLFVAEGRATISRRYATDWFLIKDGSHQKGDPHDKHSYYSYGQPVFAVADGTIVTARGDLPDNVPGPPETFRTAIPKTLETIAGNAVVIDIGDGQFASYFHLEPGSLRVKPGDRVKRGDMLARIGVSGDSNVPHLHFEVVTAVKPLTGEGVPYVIDEFRVKAADGQWQTIRRELPMRNMLVDFGPIRGGAD